jgi:hypothetical protein
LLTEQYALLPNLHSALHTAACYIATQHPRSIDLRPSRLHPAQPRASDLSTHHSRLTSHLAVSSSLSHVYKLNFKIVGRFHSTSSTVSLPSLFSLKQTVNRTMPQCTDCEGARYDHCVPCRGSGTDIQDCVTCRGAGGFTLHVDGHEHWEPCGVCSGEGRYEGTCQSCNGTGSIESHCSKCGGTGYLPESPARDEGDGSMVIDIDDDSDSD